MKISVVVPVYNTEKYIERCIESILAQTFTNWELILVDDGSTDRSPQILDGYERMDSRIKVVHQKNTGPGMARNNGMKKAVGFYTVFIDSDDVIKNDYFEKLSHETADVVFIDVNQVDNNHHIIHEEHLSNYNSLSKDDFIRYQMTGKILWGGVRKAVKTELLSRNQIEFSNHRVGEEAIYSFLLMYYANSFSFIKGAVYEYIKREGSQSSNNAIDPLDGVVAALKDKISHMGLYSLYANTINAFWTTAAIVSLDRIASNNDYSSYLLKAKKRLEQYDREIDKAFPTDLQHMPRKARIMHLFLKRCWLMPIYVASFLNRAISKTGK